MDPYYFDRLEVRLLNGLAYLSERLGPSAREQLINRLAKLGPVTEIMFVCTGNICRSAYAEKRLQMMLPSTLEAPAPAVTSAGVCTTAGKPADAVAAQVAALRGVVLDQHCTRSLSQEDCARASILLAMHPAHLRLIARLSRPALDKTFLLGQFGLRRNMHSPLVIDDPYGHPPPSFEKCFNDIDYCLEEFGQLLLAR